MAPASGRCLTRSVSALVTSQHPFPGFPSRSDATAIPAAFFSEVLPALHDLLELKTVLVAIRRIKRQKGSVRWVSDAELRDAPELAGNAPQSIDAAAASATARGLLLHLPLAESGTAQRCAYFLNDPEGRKAISRVRTGAVEIADGATVADPTPIATQGVPAPLNIFRLYEDTIGTIPGARIAEELADAESAFPDDWIADAFREAAAQNVRRWAYVRAILARWREEGKEGPIDGTTERRASKGRYRAGRYGRVVRWD